MGSRFRSLDEAVDHINSTKKEEAPPPAPSQAEEESRWWSYTSKQNIVLEGELVQRTVSDYTVSNLPGIRYQKCGGGRRVIRKSLRRN
jgi:hypothetical protein